MTVTPADQIPVSVRRMAAAVHEAGHALVAIKLGRKVTGAILRQPQGLSGETQFENEPDKLLDLNVKANRHILEDAIVVLMAGKISEAEHWKRLSSLYQPNVDTHRDDFAEIERLIADLFDDRRREDYLAHCAKRAESIILAKESQAAITEISQNLSSAMIITRDELNKILVKFQVIQDSSPPQACERTSED